MIDLAIDFRFSSDTTFVRAFRRRFGVTPGEVKQLTAEASQLRVDPLAWLRELSQN